MQNSPNSTLNRFVMQVNTKGLRWSGVFWSRPHRVRLHPCSFSCMCRLWSAWHPLMEIQGGIRDDTGNRIETNTLIRNREESADDGAIWSASSWGSERCWERRKEKVPSHPCVVSIPYVMDVQTAARIPTNILTYCYVYLCAHFKWVF